MCVISSWAHLIPNCDFIKWKTRRLRCCDHGSLQSETDRVSFMSFHWVFLPKCVAYPAFLNSLPIVTSSRGRHEGCGAVITSVWSPSRMGYLIGFLKIKKIWKLIPGSHQGWARGSAYWLDVEVAQNCAVFSERMQIWRNDCFPWFWSSSEIYFCFAFKMQFLDYSMACHWSQDHLPKSKSHLAC